MNQSQAKARKEILLATRANLLEAIQKVNLAVFDPDDPVALTVALRAAESAVKRIKGVSR